MGEHCPTCGEPVKVVGRTTHHYESVAAQRIRELEAERDSYRVEICHLEDEADRYREALERAQKAIWTGDFRRAEAIIAAALQGDEDG